MTNTEFTMLMAKLDSLENGQRVIQADLKQLHGTDASLRERVRALEAERGRYATFKTLVTTGLLSASGGIAGAHGLSQLL